MDRDSLRVVFIGPPGVGKGTQAQRLAEQRGVAKISTGDVLREAVRAKTPLGLRAKEFIDKGALVPDELVIEMLEERLGADDTGNGYLLDGFPRTIGQADALQKMMTERNETLDRVIVFDANNDVVVERLSGRRGCQKCSRVYHARFSPSPGGDRCGVCDGELVQRDDDREDVIRQRLKVYQEDTAPLLAYYQNRGVVTSVDGTMSIEHVAASVDAALRTSSTA